VGGYPLIVVALCGPGYRLHRPGRGITGNDTGGIIPYSPAVDGS